MTNHLAMTPADRRRKIRRLQEKSVRLKHDGDRAVHAHPQESGVGFTLWDEASDIRFALGYVARHVNLETGELTISLNEPEEVA